MNAIRMPYPQQPVANAQHLPIFSLLPVEIVRVIFEVSAQDSGQTAARLVRVSSLVREWILPILYETVIIGNPKQCAQIWANLSKCEFRPDGDVCDATPRLSSLVRNVCLYVSQAVEAMNWIASVLNEAIIPTSLAREADLISLLHSCTNIESMYINVALDFSGSVHHPFSHLTQLHCGSWDAWLYFSHNLHIFSTLTHLRVDIAYNNGLSRSWTPLQAPSKYLPNLTHLAFGMDSRCIVPELRGTAVFVSDILARPGMTMVIATTWFSWSIKGVLDAFSDLKDPRFFVLNIRGSPDDSSSVVEWEAQARGQKCIWDIPLTSSSGYLTQEH